MGLAMCDSGNAHAALDLEIQLAELDVKILKQSKQGLIVHDKMHAAQDAGDTELVDQLSAGLFGGRG